jgi:hypothetical protein
MIPNPSDLRRARRIADAVYMRRIGLDIPPGTDMDDVVEAHEVDDRRWGFEQHALPRREDT